MMRIRQRHNASQEILSMKFGVDEVAGSLGFTTLIASFVGSFVLPPSQSMAPEEIYVRFLIGALAFFLTYSAICFSAQRTGGMKGAPLIFVACVGSLAYAFGSFQIPLTFAWSTAAFALACAGLAADFALWFECICKLKGKMLLFAIAFSLCAGAFLALGISFAGPGPSHIVFAACTFASLGLIVAMRSMHPEAFCCDITNRESDKRSRIKLISTVMLASSFFELGFVFAFAFGTDAVFWCMAASGATSVVVMLDVLGDHVINERSLSPLTPPLTVMSFMLLFMFSGAVQTVALCLITMLQTVFCISGWAAMAEHVRLCRLSPVRVYAKARAFDYVGFTLGFVAGGFAAMLPMDYGACLGAAISAVFCLLAFFLHKPRYPESGFERTVPQEGAGVRASWDDRCRAVGEKYGLSERQQEILLLIAQGRNAKYIEKSLVISLSTVQTHIRNVYRKLGVHSRQELIDLVENTKLYGED